MSIERMMHKLATRSFPHALLVPLISNAVSHPDVYKSIPHLKQLVKKTHVSHEVDSNPRLQHNGS